MKPKITSSIQIYKGKTFNVLHQNVKFENSNMIDYEFIDREEVALIIPLISDDTVVILNQYRASINNYILEFPAGKRKLNEPIEKTAIRELEEETGYKAKNIKLVGSFYTAPHFTNEKIYVFIASNLESGEKSLEEKEIIYSTQISLNDLLMKHRDGKIIDGKTNIAITILNQL